MADLLKDPTFVKGILTVGTKSTLAAGDVDTSLFGDFTNESGLADADRIPFFDASAAANRDMAASDLKAYLNYSEGTWTPAFTGLTEVGGSATKTGRYTRIGRMVFFVVTVTAIVTTAAVAGTTYCDLPVAAGQDDTCDTVDRTTNVGIGNGVVDSTNDRCYPAGWAATADKIVFSGKYEV